jgi:hypothetical protein
VRKRTSVVGFLDDFGLVEVMEVCCKSLRIVEQTYTLDEKIFLVLSGDLFIPISSPQCKEAGMPIRGWIEDDVSSFRRIFRDRIVVRIQGLFGLFQLDKVPHRCSELTLMVEVSLGYSLSTESLDVGGNLVGTLVQISQDTHKGPSSQEDHQSGEQQDVLKRYRGLWEESV